MAEISLLLRKEIFFTYGECRKNLNDTVRLLVERYSNEDFTKFKVQRVVNLFEDTGSVSELNRVRTKHVTGNEEIRIIQAFEEHPTSSVRNISQLLNVEVSRASIHRILKAKKYHPFNSRLHTQVGSVSFLSRVKIVCQGVAEVN
jgi:hypothetical protein